MKYSAETVGQARARLEQTDLHEQFLRDLRSQDFVDLYLSEDSDSHRRGQFSALLSPEAVPTALEDASWDLTIGSGMPYASVGRDEKGTPRVVYSRLGDESGVEPIVMHQQFHGIRPDQVEISAEFRHFHNLYHDKSTGQYIKISDDGAEEVVAVVTDNQVQVRLKELRQYLTARGMHCALYIDSVRMTTHSQTDMGKKDAKGRESRTPDSVLALSFGDCGWTEPDELKGFSRMLGKRLIPPLPLEQSGLPGAAPAMRSFADFIIGEDANGTPIRHACDPEHLSNDFGLNPGKPHYLTPVWFKREVLDRYYAQPSKFSVEDGLLRCAGLWLMRMDNHGMGDVMVWLGDLGRELPESHQAHWLQHNCMPRSDISEVAFRRQILAEFTDSNHPEHVFKQRYQALVEQTQHQNGWPLFLPLAPGDAHHFTALRVPVRDEQPEFDSQIGSLVKLLVDSLNEKHLLALIPHAEHKADMKGLDKLQHVLEKGNVAGSTQCIQFLRALQDLRSSGIAHRKGERYTKATAALGVTDRERDKAFAALLVHANDYVLACLYSAIGRGTFRV